MRFCDLASAFRAWERDVSLWQSAREEGEDVPCPKKPAGYDLWKQGDDPLDLDSKEGVCCHGGGLVPDDWTSDALPVRLPEQRLEQPNLL